MVGQRQGMLQGKKGVNHTFFRGKTAENWRVYEEAEKVAKEVVAVAKSAHYGGVNENIEIVYSLCINDGNCHLMTNQKRMERFHYFKQISTVEITYPPLLPVPPNGPL